MQLTISQNQAARFIRDSNGTVFTVVFRKRTGNRELRTMRARTNVKKGLKGGPAPYDPKSHGLIFVYTMSGDENAQQRRSIPIDGIQKLRIGGSTFHVVPSI